MKHGPQRPVNSSSISLHPRPNQTPVAFTGTNRAERLREVCDGIDNNCDGEIDELEQCCQRHEDCRSELSDMFCDMETRECVGCRTNTECRDRITDRPYCHLETDAVNVTPRRILDPHSDVLRPPLDASLMRSHPMRVLPARCPYWGEWVPLSTPCIQDEDAVRRLNVFNAVAIVHVLASWCACPSNRQTKVFVGAAKSAFPMPLYPVNSVKAVPLAHIVRTQLAVQNAPDTQEEARAPDTPYCLRGDDGEWGCRSCMTDLDCLKAPGAGPYCDPNSRRCHTCRPGTRDGCSRATPFCGDEAPWLGICESVKAGMSVGAGDCTGDTEALNCDELEPGFDQQDCERPGECVDCDATATDVANPCMELTARCVKEHLCGLSRPV